MNDEVCCRFLPWDTAHFQVRIGRVEIHRLTPATLRRIDRWTSAESIDCIYFLADPDPETLRVAAAGGFRLVDIRVTLASEISACADHVATQHTSAPALIRPATPGDIPDLRRIAAESHTGSRFYWDGNFSTARCDELYRIWIERSCCDPEFAGAVLVAEHNGHAVAYISCKVAAGEGVIGLVAVQAGFRGTGLGSLLLAHAAAWFARNGVLRATVVTQGSNLAAQRLYQRAGFVVYSLQLWYHRWLRPTSENK